MTIAVGEVIAVTGTKVTVRVFDDSNLETLFLNGERYRGVSIREYIAIQRGFRDIICQVEGEFLNENLQTTDADDPQYIRKIELRPIGYFDGDKFIHGIKYLPMIRDKANLLSDASIKRIFGRPRAKDLIFGVTVKDEIPIALPWSKLFNSHIGIFGNTGSGKSNTVARLFTTLFSNLGAGIRGKSKFVIVDFNGEYTTGQFPTVDKKVINLSTDPRFKGDTFTLSPSEFWDLETIALLFQATTQTQRPFLSRLLNGRAKYEEKEDSLVNYVRATIRAVFSAASPSAEHLDLVRNIAKLISSKQLGDKLSNVAWNSTTRTFYISMPGSNKYFNADSSTYDAYFAEAVEQLQLPHIDEFDQLILRANLQLSWDLLLGYVQFEHIQPLMKRIESSMDALRKVISVQHFNYEMPTVTVVSFRRCNSDVKKIVPLLIAKQLYFVQKQIVAQPPDRTLHLIVDEAHNILSLQSTRESGSWKDYRLELFEEIIKEGRKFGTFLTIASQRPSDISATITSQVHNFFLHRLVNERDLALIESSISTLDELSRSMIPNLPAGCCIATGIAFEMPFLIQVLPLSKDSRPDSDDVDLVALWDQ